MTMSLSCNIITAVTSITIISAFGASLSVSISAYGVSKNFSNDIYVRFIHLACTQHFFLLDTQGGRKRFFQENFAYILHE